MQNGWAICLCVPSLAQKCHINVKTVRQVLNVQWLISFQSCDSRKQWYLYTMNNMIWRNWHISVSFKVFMFRGAACLLKFWALQPKAKLDEIEFWFRIVGKSCVKDIQMRFGQLCPEKGNVWVQREAVPPGENTTIRQSNQILEQTINWKCFISIYFSAHKLRKWCRRI